MNKSFGIALVVIAGIVLSALVFGAGLVVGRANFGSTNFGPFPMTLAPESRAGLGRNFTNQSYSMMGNSQNMMSGNGMMGNGYNMMGSNGMMGNGYNMMGWYANGSATYPTPLTIDQAKQAVESYLKGLNNSDLEIKEIMVFDNNAYARITEKSTGIGAMELLVDPSNLSVFPEYGPNMMWNLKYGHMSGNGMMGGTGGMMGGRGMTLAPAPRAGVGGYNTAPGAVSATMTVTPEQALKAAQQYLDQQYPGYQTAEDADPFYGYYTIDILKDGQPTGMLSINGFSGQVFLHTWHGTFIEMFE
jgi:hypothetical protein